MDLSKYHLNHLLGWVDAEARLLIRGVHPPSRLAGLWRALHDDLARPWTAGSMAGVVKLSEAQLWRLCKQETGQSPIARLTGMRMAAAENHLLRTTDRLADIAALVGYTSPFSFAKAFKRHFGRSPGDSRRTES